MRRVSVNEPVKLTWREGSERVFNLLIALINYGPRSMSWLADHVDGYGGPHYEAVSKESAEQQLRRDRSLLADAGVHIASRTQSVDTPSGKQRKESIWSISPEDFELPDLNFTEDEADVISAAGRWAFTHNMTRAAQSAYAKLSALGVRRTESSSIMSNVPDHTTLDGESIAALFHALDAHTVIEFYYYPSLLEEPVVRRLEPWAYGAVDGKTYLTGFDAEKLQQRTFRLSRIDSIEDTAEPCTQAVPNQEPTQLIRTGIAHSQHLVTVTVEFPNGPDAGAQELRAQVHEDGRTIGPVDRDYLVRTAASYVPDVIVTSPPDVVADIVALLTAAAGQEA